MTRARNFPDLSQSMKLLHVSDLHFRAPWFDWVAGHAPDFDAVCIAGDLLDMFRTDQTSLRTQATWVRDWIRAYSGPLFVCTGNHDWWDERGGVDNDAFGGWLDKMQSTTVTVDGHWATCAGYQIYCQPYGAPVFWPEACVGKWILLQHVPPALAATAVGAGGDVRNGCADLAGTLTAAQRPPWIVLSGHLHKPKSWRGSCGPAWSLNPTFDGDASYPNHIIIDTDAGTLTWVSERAGTWPVKVL